MRLYCNGVYFLTYRIPCTSKYPAQHVVLLRSHRSGSSTIANIMYRYGDLNDLEFALPKQKSYDFYWPLNFNPSFVDKKYLNLTPPDLLINARYSPDTMTSFMSKVRSGPPFFCGNFLCQLSMTFSPIICHLPWDPRKKITCPFLDLYNLYFIVYLFQNLQAFWFICFSWKEIVTRRNLKKCPFPLKVMVTVLLYSDFNQT